MKRAKLFVGTEHRHAPQLVGGYFALGAWLGDKLVGVVVVGQPKARMLNALGRAEVTRLATDGTANACSFLYGAARRVWQSMGGTSLKTYTLTSEPGTSLRAAGVPEPEHTTRAEAWGRVKRPRTLKATDYTTKYRWELIPQVSAV